MFDAHASVRPLTRLHTSDVKSQRDDHANGEGAARDDCSDRSVPREHFSQGWPPGQAPSTTRVETTTIGAEIINVLLQKRISGENYS